MKIVRCLESEDIVVGSIEVKGFPRKIVISNSRVDQRLTDLLDNLSETQRIECDDSETAREGVIVEKVVTRKAGDKLFWPSVDKNLREIGYHLE